MGGIRGQQIRDETIESVDLASGSIKVGELNADAVSNQATIDSVDTTNDMLLIYDANNDALKKVAPTNLGVGGSGSPGGSDTQVQFNDGSSFGGDAGLTFNKTSGLLTVAKGAVFNEGSHDSDFRVESNGNTHMFFVDGGNDKIGIGTNSPTHALHIANTGPSSLYLEADTDNVDEDDTSYIKFTQDGGNTGTVLGLCPNSASKDPAGDAYTDAVGSSFLIGTTTSTPIQFGTNDNVRMTIKQAGNVGIGTASPTYELEVAGDIGIDQYIYHNDDADTFIRLQPDDINIQAGGVDFIKITEDAAQDMLVINEGGADVDLRVETQHNDHMFYINGSASRIGIGSSSPQHTLDIQERDGVEATIRLMGTADVGIRLAADSDNSGENDNPYIDWYQDGQNSNSRINRLASIAMEGDAGVTFTGSLGNGFFLDAYCPGAVGGSNRTIQFANDSSNNGHKARITIEGTNGYVGIWKNTPEHALDVSGSAKANTFVTTPYLTDLGAGTATHLTSSNSIHFLDADSVTLATGKSYHEIFLAPGSTNGQHIQLAITSSANNPVKLMGDSGGDKAQGTVSFSGAPLNGQTVSFPNVGGSTTYVVTWDELEAVGNYAIPDATNITAGIGGAVSGNDMGFALYGALDTGISVSSWPFTLVGTYGGEDSVTLSQTSAGTSGNQTITENSDNTTVTGFSGGTELVVGTINSTYGIALSNAAGEPQGAHLIYDSNSEQWQIIAGNALSS